VKVACTVLGRERASNRSFLFDYAVKVACTVLRREGAGNRSFLFDYEAKVSRTVLRRGGGSNPFFLFGDFIVTAKTEEIAKEAKELIKDFLKDRGLELSDEKTLITHIDSGFDFLGWNFRKYSGKLLIKPSNKSIDKFTGKISDTIKNGKAWKQEALIDTLNPIITGWTNYHRSVISSEIFGSVLN